MYGIGIDEVSTVMVNTLYRIFTLQMYMMSLCTVRDLLAIHPDAHLLGYVEDCTLTAHRLHRYAAGVIGKGSEVLGFDTAVSTDHDFGARVMLFVESDEVCELSDSASSYVPLKVVVFLSPRKSWMINAQTHA